MLWLVLVLLWSSEVYAVDVSCKNEKSENVDWFILYKAPAGVAFIYIDAKGNRTMSSIDDGDGVLVHTLSPMLGSIRNMPSSFGFLSYSDQPPGAEADSDLFGHSKGVVLGDSSSQTALWLTHSTPQFPFRRNQNHFWPKSGNRNGQTFLCVSLPFTELKKVGEHLQNIRAFPFDYDLPTGFPQELRDAADWKHSDSLLGKFQNLKTRGNTVLKSMAKPVNEKAADGDLYVKLAAGLNSDLLAQTWGCQRGRDESFCSKDKKQVKNVEEITTELKTWSTTQDHSKWAVTTEPNIAWTCFGDVNRSMTQYLRWGGALCIRDKKVNEFFKAFANKPLPCRKRPRSCSSP